MYPLDDLIDRLPQKPPFLFVDHILEVEPLKRVVGSKVFPEGHPIFENHFPGEPLLPGVIVIEALAQLAGVAFIKKDGAPLRGYLGEVKRVRFHRLVRPGEAILLRAEVEQVFGDFARFSVEAEVAGERVADGAIIVVRRQEP